MELRELAEERRSLGIDLITLESDVHSDASHLWLCLDDAERRGITEYDNFSFIYGDDGHLPSPCADCGRLI